jgi:hypothetical protein
MSVFAVPFRGSLGRLIACARMSVRHARRVGGANCGGREKSRNMTADANADARIPCSIVIPGQRAPTFEAHDHGFMQGQQFRGIRSAVHHRHQVTVVRCRDRRARWNCRSRGPGCAQPVASNECRSQKIACRAVRAAEETSAPPCGSATRADGIEMRLLVDQGGVTTQSVAS